MGVQISIFTIHPDICQRLGKEIEEYIPILPYVLYRTSLLIQGPISFSILFIPYVNTTLEK